MSLRNLKSFSTIGLLAMLAGCANSAGSYPSLEMRPGERVSGTFEPPAPEAPPPPPAVASADLVARLAELRAEASAAHGDFLEAAPGARRLASAAAGSAIGSDSWASAQVALADLDSARSRAAVPLGTLDILYVDASIANEARSEIDSVRSAVIAMLEEEDAVLAQLRANVR